MRCDRGGETVTTSVPAFMKNRKQTLSKKQAIEHMRKGGALVHMHTRDFGRQYFVVPGGPINKQTADEIKQRPDVLGQRDGLFPGHDQTWRMVRL
jgi:hypothetical protein